ncbi:MAG: DUF3048 domain-containing protein [Clostridia bacterium]
MTRFVASLQDYDQVEKIGPVRSARRYFIDFALDQSAVLIHFGRIPASLRCTVRWAAPT